MKTRIFPEIEKTEILINLNDQCNLAELLTIEQLVEDGSIRRMAEIKIIKESAEEQKINI